MIIVCANALLELLGQVHAGKVIVCVEDLIQSISHQGGFLLKGGESLGVDEEGAQVVTIDVELKIGQQIANQLLQHPHLGIERADDTDENGFQGAKFVGQATDPLVALSKLPLQVIHKDGLGVAVRAPKDVKQQDHVGLDQSTDVKEIDENGVWADEDGGDDGVEAGVEFA